MFKNAVVCSTESRWYGDWHWKSISGWWWGGSNRSTESTSRISILDAGLDSFNQRKMVDRWCGTKVAELNFLPRKIFRETGILIVVWYINSWRSYEGGCLFRTENSPDMGVSIKVWISVRCVSERERLSNGSWMGKWDGRAKWTRFIQEYAYRFHCNNQDVDECRRGHQFCIYEAIINENYVYSQFTGNCRAADSERRLTEIDFGIILIRRKESHFLSSFIQRFTLSMRFNLWLSNSWGGYA